MKSTDREAAVVLLLAELALSLNPGATLVRVETRGDGGRLLDVLDFDPRAIPGASGASASTRSPAPALGG